MMSYYLSPTNLNFDPDREAQLAAVERAVRLGGGAPKSTGSLGVGFLVDPAKRHKVRPPGSFKRGGKANNRAFQQFWVG